MGIKDEVKEVISRMETCLDDEFEVFFESDIRIWIHDLEEIKKRYVRKR